MSHVRFVTENQLETSSISIVKGSSVPTMPLSSLNNYTRGRFARIVKNSVDEPTKDSVILKLDCSLAKPALSSIVIGPSNFEPSTYVNLKVMSRPSALYTSSNGIHNNVVIPVTLGFFSTITVTANVTYNSSTAEYVSTDSNSDSYKFRLNDAVFITDVLPVNTKIETVTLVGASAPIGSLTTATGFILGLTDTNLNSIAESSLTATVELGPVLWRLSKHYVCVKSEDTSATCSASFTAGTSSILTVTTVNASEYRRFYDNYVLAGTVINYTAGSSIGACTVSSVSSSTTSTSISYAITVSTISHSNTAHSGAAAINIDFPGFEPWLTYIPVVPFGTLQWGLETLGERYLDTTNIKPFWLTDAGSPIQEVETVYLMVYDADTNVSFFNIAYLMGGVYFEPERDVSKGAKLQIEDTTQHYRTEDGSLRSTTGFKYRKFNLQFEYITEGERARFRRRFSKSNPFLLSVFQESQSGSATVESTQELDYTSMVKLSSNQSFDLPVWGLFNTGLEVEEV